MRKLVYYIAVSLDGRIAGPHDEADFFPAGHGQAAADYLEWVNQRYPETVPTQFRVPAGLADEPNLRFDAVVMGMGTYRVAERQGIESPYAHLDQYVATGSGRDLGPGVITSTDAVGLVRDLKAQEGLDIWLCGGGNLAGALLDEIDELIVKQYPVIAGAGPALVDCDFRPELFAVADRHAFDNGVTITRYERIPAGG